MKTRILAAAFLALAPHGATADEFRPALEAYLETELRAWINDPVIVAAIKSQNARTSGYDNARIDALDAAWRDGVGQTDTALIQEVLQNAAADFLRARVAASGGTISEAFAMDQHGLNVAASAPTSDYWQGDEAKFQMTFGTGPDAIHVSEVEFDESSQTYQGQISVVVIDPSDNRPIGAITIGVNAESLL